MGISVTIPPDEDNSKPQCKIQTKNLFYSLSPQEGKVGWLCWREAVSPCNNSTMHILRDINFEARPGEITAIAGPSGAGKTILLEILAGSALPAGRVSGHILVNNQPMINAYNLSRMSGYVTQEEALFPLLTVEETLLFSAYFRLKKGGGHEAENPNAKVRDLIRELGLENIAGKRIGGGQSTTRREGISGGEKRRVSIGVELVHDPGVLFIDEPTSGLDSGSALQVMTLLKSIVVKRGKTIIITIHQPGFRVLELIDHIILLSRGVITYQGPLFLLEERLKLAGKEIPSSVSVLEFAIELNESLVTIENHGDDNKNQLAGDNDLEPNSQCNKKHSSEILDDDVNERNFVYANSRTKEVLILAKRFCYNIFRTKELFATRITQAVVAGLILGNIFMNTSNNLKKAKLQTHLGFMAFSLTVLLSSTTEALPIFLQERRILFREISRGAYRVSSYILANTLVFAPFLLVVALLYSTPVYWLVGLRQEIDGFLYFCLVSWLVLLMSNSFVAACSTVVPSFVMGSSLIAGTMGGFFLFSGYFISREDIPKYWVFMHYLSLFRYPFECFILNEYGGEQGRKKCVQSVRGECLLYGDWIVTEQGLKESQKWSNLGVMLGFIFGYRFLGFLVLWYRSYGARDRKMFSFWPLTRMMSKGWVIKRTGESS